MTISGSSRHSGTISFFFRNQGALVLLEKFDLKIQVEKSMMEPSVSAEEVAKINLRLANISSSLQDNDMMEDDEFQVDK